MFLANKFQIKEKEGSPAKVEKSRNHSVGEYCGWLGIWKYWRQTMPFYKSKGNTNRDQILFALN